MIPKDHAQTRGRAMLEMKSVTRATAFPGVVRRQPRRQSGRGGGRDRPNGAGKTTLMRVISGLIRPRAGAISMEGVDVLKTPEHRIVSLGIAHVRRTGGCFPA